MRRPGPFDLALVTVAAVVTLVLVLLDPAAGAPEWVFGTFLLVLAGYVGRAAVTSALRARSARTQALRLAATEPATVALAAIEEERRRLAEEIAATLRETMTAIRDESEAIDGADPRPGLHRIHERTQAATSDLRRQLGLLRRSDPPPEVAAGEPSGPVLPRVDQVLAVVLAALAAVETAAYLRMEAQTDLVPWSVLLSTLAAACVLGRTVAPGLACTTCAAIFVAGSVAGFPVLMGFWGFGTVGGLVWQVASRARVRSLDLPGGLALVAATTWTRQLDDPANLGIAVLMMGAAAAGGLAVRLARHRESRSRSRAAAREAELADAARVAVHAERVGFARELHDVTSHAVGVIAMQAAAGQVSWPHDPDAVARVVEVIRATAGAALAELDRLGPDRRPPARGTGDLCELAARIRATGTPVDLTVLDEPPPGLATVVHRVVQEALTNAVRHAPGSVVSVRIERRAERLVVTVQDEGQGLADPATRGYGLVGLAERVSLAGGTLRTGGAASRGFLVEAALPVDRTEVTP